MHVVEASHRYSRVLAFAHLDRDRPYRPQCCQEECFQIPRPVDTDVLIVGAGAAGLYAADLLKRAGIRFIVLEADGHAGGRVHSRPEMKTHLGLVLDEGANLINSTDRIAISLLNRFGIGYVRRLTLGQDPMHYVYGAQVFDQAQMEAYLFKSSATCLAQIAADEVLWNKDEGRAHNPVFINDSIAAYLARHGACPALMTVLRSFFWSEYGRALEHLNLHVLLDYLQVDLVGKSFALIPNVDEAYTVPGGAGQITDRLEKACHDQIEYERRVFLIKDSNSEHITVRAHDENMQAKSYRARMLFFAAPLHSLKKIDVSVEGLSMEALAEARAVTYGRGTKLHMKFKAGFHKLYHYPGILLTDTGEQIWPSSTGQGGAGLLTVLTGPMAVDEQVMSEKVAQVLDVLEIASPGIGAHFEGAERSEAPMSYSGALRPGEDADLLINEGGLRWTTIGEASSIELQGYLEGALRTAEEAASLYIKQHRARVRVN
jgi:monoamine oxidase